MSSHAVGTLARWERSSFTHNGVTRDTFRQGAGPGVVVIHEIPGITPNVAAFGQDVVDAGFTVVMPSLLGDPGRPISVRYGLRSVARLCISREFTKWGCGETSPAVAWCRALAAQLHRDAGGNGVGAIGMCFSGGFALAMMVDNIVVAPVLSQPSLPLAMLGKRRAADVNLSPADLATVKVRAAGGCEVLGLRFSGDKLTGTRFETLRRELGHRFIAVEYPSTTKRDHSVVTEQRQSDGVEQVLAFFREKLHDAV